MRRLALLAALITVPCLAQQIAINDLAAGKYLGQYEGGLYENGTNVVPADHAANGAAQAALVRPLDANGHPSPAGKIVMISVGMSNTTQEFCATGNPAPCTSWSFVGQASQDSSVNHSTLILVNGARGGQSAGTWDSPSKTNYDLVRTQDLAPAGLTEAQVQVAWLKVANPQPTTSLPAANSDAFTLVAQMGNIARAMKTHYPNLRIVYISSRIYAGYATTPLNPEPYAYESGFAVKWIVQAQIDQERSGHIDPRAGDLDFNSGVAPWIAWGPYMWADGTNARSDGLIWARADLQSDGTHPSQSGQQKVGAMLLDFLKREPTARAWFLEAPESRRRRAISH
jgi:hypothetical protein